jgi:hypothetical protein
VWQQEQRHKNRAATARQTVVQEGTQTSTSMLINVTNETLSTPVTNIVTVTECNSVPGLIVGKALQWSVPSDRYISLSSHGVSDCG